MKKIFLYFPVVLLLLMLLVSCSNENFGNQNKDESKDSEITNEVNASNDSNDNSSNHEDNDIKHLKIGEIYSIGGELDLTITGFYFSDKYDSPEHFKEERMIPFETEIAVNVFYNINYKGKKPVDAHNFEPTGLKYDKDYNFYLQNFYYLDDNGYWLGDGTVEPLSDEFPCKAVFLIKRKLVEDRDKSIDIEFYNGNIVFSLRPSQEEYKEALLQYAKNLFNSNNEEDLCKARAMMMELYDYKDAGNQARLIAFTDEDVDYFKEYFGSKSPIPEDEFIKLIKGSTFVARTHHIVDDYKNYTFTFRDDDLLETDWIYLGSPFETWRWEEGKLIFSKDIINRYGEAKTVEASFIPYVYNDNIVMLIGDERHLAIMLMVDTKKL